MKCGAVFVSKLCKSLKGSEGRRRTGRGPEKNWQKSLEEFSLLETWPFKKLRIFRRMKEEKEEESGTAVEDVRRLFSLRKLGFKKLRTFRRNEGTKKGKMGQGR